jgi:hypothetical protein
MVIAGGSLKNAVMTGMSTTAATRARSERNSFIERVGSVPSGGYVNDKGL